MKADNISSKAINSNTKTLAPFFLNKPVIHTKLELIARNPYRYEKYPLIPNKDNIKLP